MSFVTRPPAPPADPVEPEAIIANDGWFPDINPAELRRDHRIHEAVTPARLREAIVAAILTVEVDLRAWQIDQLAAGHDSLEAVPAPLINEESRLVIAYRRAVALFAKAEVAERSRDFDTTAAGMREAGSIDPAIADIRRDARHAVRDILGLRRTMVELI